MKKLALILPILIVLSFLSGQAFAKNLLEGVWKVSEIVITGNNASTMSNPQPGLIVFGKKYFSMMYVPSEKERPIYAGTSPTPNEKIAAFDSLVANAGTYELSGKTLTIRPTVARNPGFTGGGYATYTIRAEGKTVWLTIKNTAFNFRVGDKIVPLSGPASETTIKLTRLE